MREALGNLGIDPDQKSAATKVVLAHILTLDSPAREMADFLTEPSFNLPGTDHHLNLVLGLKLTQDPALRDGGEGDGNLVRLRAYFMAPQNWQTLHKALCRAAQLGLIRPGSFEYVMDHLYRYADASAEESTREALQREAGELLANFKESRLFGLQDLNQLWVSAFVDKLLSESLTAASWKLLLALRDEDEVLSIIKDSRLPPLTTSGLDAAVAFLQSFSKSRLSKVRESMQRRPLAPCSAQVLSRLLPEGDFVGWLKGTLIDRMQNEISVDENKVVQMLPDRILAHVLASVTEEILVKTWSGECGPEVMYGWGKVITSLDRISFKQWLLDQSNFNLMCSTLSCRLGQQEQFLVGVWILVKLCWSRARATSISQQLSLREAFDRLFPALLRAFNFGAEQLKLFTQSLPFEGTFVQKLSLLLNREHLSELTARVDVGEEGKQPTEVSVSNLMDDDLYRQLQTKSVDGLCELGESINADLSTFAQISRKLIHGDKYAIRVVKRLLQHNLPIKTSLSQSAPQRIQSRALQEHASDGATEAASMHSHSRVGRQTGQSHLLPSQALGLMERLALAFALAPSLSARSALVQVHWCYTFLHRYGAPITPAITRALWHAGVTRYHGNGPSYSQMHWILKIVSEVEGQGVAGMLLWNSDFRKRREAILRTVASEVAADEEGGEKKAMKQNGSAGRGRRQ
ncbi:hypothetical protein DV737_g2742, partial [Chaetothyriales sp. CBS 132003]